MGDLSTHEAQLAPILQRYSSAPIPHIIDGERVLGKAQFETRSPVDGSVIAQVSMGDAEEIDRAAQAAKTAFPEWAAMAGEKRKAVLHKIADFIVERAQEIALAECWDTGQAYRFMAKAALRGAENFRYFADLAPSACDGQSLPTANHLNITSRMPTGPVGVITPWNTPFMLSTWKIAPALAAGCTVVHKPAEFSPVTAGILCDICHEAGLPPGVLNTVHGLGETAGKALTEHRDIKAIAFVGESRTGSMIMKQGADTLKRVHFELGGKNPVVVFDDADLDRALDAVIFMIYSLNGERCTSSSRLLIQDTVADAFEAKLIERIERIKVGNPLDPDTEIGPLIHQTHFEKVTSYFDVARREGATVAAGGRALERAGWFVEPTLFTGARPSMKIAREEIFGPVLTSLRFQDEEEALAIANAVDYGLTGYVWTNDLTRGLRFSNGLEAGMIWVNSENVRHLPTPFGGMKQSGIGRDGAQWSFDFYMEQKNVAFALGAHTIPRLGV
ncbi:MAG: 5-carboxymethyl-2-hydroxymuconate semialdehyde dehydrogenase [Pseudomonadota bacterium]